MPDHTVIWTINLDADSPVDAALQAKTLVNDIDFGPDSANVFHTLPGVHDVLSTLPGATTVDLGQAEITEDDQITNLDELVEPAPTAGPTETRRVQVTETITYDISVDVAEMAAADIDPEDTDSDQLDSFIADITSSLHTGQYSFSVEDCQREITWLT